MWSGEDVRGERVSMASCATRLDWNCSTRFKTVATTKRTKFSGVGASKAAPCVRTTVFSFIIIKTSTLKIKIKKINEIVLDESSHMFTI